MSTCMRRRVRLTSVCSFFFATKSVNNSLTLIFVLLSSRWFLLTMLSRTGWPIACEDYKLPARLFQHVDIVLPTVHFDTIPSTNKYHYAGVGQDAPMTAKKNKRYTSTEQSFAAPQIVPVPGAARRLGNPNSGNIPHYSQDFNRSIISTIKHDLAHCANFTTMECLK